MLNLKNCCLALIVVMALFFTQFSFGFLNPFRNTPVQLVLENAPTLNPAVLDLAFTAYQKAQRNGKILKPFLTIIDYSLPSTEKRLWLVDLKNKKVVLNTWVAHGSGTGDKYAKHFSNQPGSHQSSLGVFITGQTYQGKHGTSLVLHGLEPGINHKAASRSIVMHGAAYVSERYIKDTGRLGRSWGCPAVSFQVSNRIINMIKEGSLVFSYYPHQPWIQTSHFLQN